MYIQFNSNSSSTDQSLLAVQLYTYPKMQCSDFIPVTPRDHYYHLDDVKRTNQKHR